MEETGGTVEDYVRLNADYSDVHQETLLKEYYKQTKPHLDIEEIDFLLEDNFHMMKKWMKKEILRKKSLLLKKKLQKPKTFWKKPRVSITTRSS